MALLHVGRCGMAARLVVSYLGANTLLLCADISRAGFELKIARSISLRTSLPKARGHCARYAMLL